MEKGAIRRENQKAQLWGNRRQKSLWHARLQRLVKDCHSLLCPQWATSGRSVEPIIRHGGKSGEGENTFSAPKNFYRQGNAVLHVTKLQKKTRLKIMKQQLRKSKMKSNKIKKNYKKSRRKIFHYRYQKSIKRYRL